MEGQIIFTYVLLTFLVGTNIVFIGDSSGLKRNI